MLAAGAILVMVGVVVPLSTTHVIFALPIAVQEMALAVWLIVKGFNPKTLL